MGCLTSASLIGQEVILSITVIPHHHLHGFLDVSAVQGLGELSSIQAKVPLCLSILKLWVHAIEDFSFLLLLLFQTK